MKWEVMRNVEVQERFQTGKAKSSNDSRDLQEGLILGVVVHWPTLQQNHSSAIRLKLPALCSVGLWITYG